MIDDLSAFLLARYEAEEQTVYRADSDGKYRIAWATFRQPDGSMDHTALASDHNDDIWVTEGEAVYEMDTPPTIDEPVVDAAHVLADIDAKRRIVELHKRCGTGVGYCDDGGHGWDDVDGGGCADLALLALPYRDDPGYQPEWGVE